MNWLDKYILKRASAIRERQKAERAAEDLKQSNRQEKINELRKRLTDIVNLRAEELEQIPCHIKEGDNCYLNIYSLTCEGRNGWDGGPASLLNFITQKETLDKMPVFAITRVYVDASLAMERIDNFIDSCDDYVLGVYFDQTVKNLESAYREWCFTKKTQQDFCDILGLYKSADFSSSCVFQPKWGLNVNSFLKVNSPAGKETAKIYRRQLKIDKLSTSILAYREETDKMINQASLDFPKKN